ncbi:hypothetical protein [Aquiflexum sp.]|uniref:hypothetical protein n=1 Tax=Aquiflexum sp. TaxID=1872584 RepID=UPI0035945F79
MKLSISIFLLFVLLLFQCSPKTEKPPTFTLDFMDSDEATVFGEGIISTRNFERDFALSPNGDELFYTIQHPRTGFSIIIQSSKSGDEWTGPEVASFSDSYSDLEPAFSPDGKKLFFSSNRPKTDGAEITDMDIWYVEKETGTWGNPINVGSPVNSDKNEFFPSIAKNGNLYFTASREGGVGREDIFLCRFENGRYLEPVALDTAINSPMDEFNAFVDPDEEFLIFSAWGRKVDRGRGDLYISFKDSTDNWLPAKNLGDKINSKSLDYCPFVSFDGKYLFFTSDRMDTELFKNKFLDLKNYRELLDAPLNGGGNIYMINITEVLKLK